MAGQLPELLPQESSLASAVASRIADDPGKDVSPIVDDTEMIVPEDDNRNSSSGFPSQQMLSDVKIAVPAVPESQEMSDEFLIDSAMALFAVSRFEFQTEVL